MLIKFKLDKDSVIKLLCNSMVNTKTFNKTKLCVYIYLLCLLGLVFALSDEKNMRIGSIIMCAIASIFLKPYTKIVYKYILTKKFNKEGHSYMFKEMTICIKEDNINIINSMGERSIKFSSISSVNVVEDFLFIILSNKEYKLIPLSAFDFTVKKDDFINLLEKKAKLKAINLYPENLSFI